MPSWFITDVNTPMGLLEELFSDDPWRLLISTIFLNRTSRVQVDVILFHFLQEWPSAAAAVKADPEVMAELIQPLGMKNRRASGIIRFSKEYLMLLKAKREEKLNLAKEETNIGQERQEKDVDDNCSENAFNLSREDILGLYYCGEYAYAAYRLFILRDSRADHPDRALTWYVEYQRARKEECKEIGL